MFAKKIIQKFINVQPNRVCPLSPLTILYPSVPFASVVVVGIDTAAAALFTSGNEIGSSLIVNLVMEFFVKLVLPSRPA